VPAAMQQSSRPHRVGARPQPLPSWPDRAEITSPSAIAMLATMRTLRLLNPFMKGPQTLTSAARELGRPPSSLAYWVPRLLGEGLLVRLGDRARAGRSMPVYRTPGRRLTVPFDALPFDQRVALLDDGRMRVLRRFLDGLDESMAQSREFSLEFGPSGSTGGSIQMVERSDPEPRDFTDGWLSLALTRVDALDLSREMEQLIERYADRAGSGTYVVHVGVAPAARHPWRSIEDPQTS
jgi:hypothetical protein